MSIEEMLKKLKEVGYKIHLCGYAGDNYEAWYCQAPDNSALFTDPVTIESGDDKKAHKKLMIERAYAHLQKERQFASQAQEIERQKLYIEGLHITLYNAESALKEVLPQLELEHKLDLAQREIAALREFVQGIASADFTGNDLRITGAAIWRDKARELNQEWGKREDGE